MATRIGSQKDLVRADSSVKVQIGGRFAKSFTTRTIFKLTSLSISILLSLVVIEVLLRVISPPSPWSPLLPLRPKRTIELRVDLKGVSPYGINSTNSWGFRGEEPPTNWNEYHTIITIGGSTTQCFYLDDKKTWSHLLQENLRDIHPQIWVGNGGLDGQTTRAHLIFMEEVITKVRPKAVVLLVGLNDLGLSLRDDRRRAGTRFDNRGPSWAIRHFGWSRTFQIAYVWKQILFEKAMVVTQAGHAEQTFAPLVDPSPVPEDLKELLPTLPEYRENLERIAELGRSVGTRVYFLTQPLRYEDDEFWQGVQGYFYWINRAKGNLSAATYWKLLDIYNKELLETCSRMNVDCFDLASVVPHSSEMFYDTGHFTEAGAEFVAERVAEWMKTLPR